MPHTLRKMSLDRISSRLKPCAFPKEPLAAWPDGKLTKSLAEVATMLGVHKNTVQRWIKSGKICCTRFGRNSIHFTFEQVQAFIDGCEHKVRINYPPSMNGGNQ